MKYLAVIVFALLLTACETTHDLVFVKADECTAMKRKMAYNRNNPNVEAASNARSQREELKQQYADLHCVA